MPGANRGSLLNIASALSGDTHKEVAKDIIMSIDHGYEIVASVPMLKAAHAECENTETLRKVWCHALERGRVDWQGY